MLGLGLVFGDNEWMRKWLGLGLGIGDVVLQTRGYLPSSSTNFLLSSFVGEAEKGLGNVEDLCTSNELMRHTRSNHRRLTKCCQGKDLLRLWG